MNKKRKIPEELKHSLRVGDIVFISIDTFLYRRVAASTQSWTSHVGMISSKSADEWIVAESRIPRCGYCGLEKFINRSMNGDYSIKRLKRELTTEELNKMDHEIRARLGQFYHLGFNYDSKRQFCSKFVYDIYKNATGVEIGKLETFEALLQKQKDYPLGFWKLWYFGRIPWKRRTISPGNLYESADLETVDERITKP